MALDNLRETLLQAKKGNDEEFLRLFHQYLPLVKAFWKNYYLCSMDFDDWEQEALIVLVKAVQRYSFTVSSSFGSFYRSILRNRIFDMIRRQNAKKRVPANALVSLSANIGFYSDTVTDKQAPCPEQRMLFKERVGKVYRRCSSFEKLALKTAFHHRNFKDVAKSQGCSVAKLMSAFERCKMKFVRLTDGREID